MKKTAVALGQAVVLTENGLAKLEGAPFAGVGRLGVWMGMSVRMIVVMAVAFPGTVLMVVIVRMIMMTIVIVLMVMSTNSNRIFPG